MNIVSIPAAGSVKELLHDMGDGTFATLQGPDLTRRMPNRVRYIAASTEVVSRGDWTRRIRLPIPASRCGLVVSLRDEVALLAKGYIRVRLGWADAWLAQVAADQVLTIEDPVAPGDQPTVALPTKTGWLYVAAAGRTTDEELTVRAIDLVERMKAASKESEATLLDATRWPEGVVVPMFTGRRVDALECLDDGLNVEGNHVGAAAQILTVNIRSANTTCLWPSPAGALQHTGSVLAVRTTRDHQVCWAARVRPSDWRAGSS